MNVITAYVCSVCGFLYDNASAEKTEKHTSITFSDLPDTWTCPGCGVKPDLFMVADSIQVPNFPENKTK